MAGGKLSPRQRMINMMYLVLTALLALNVSKEIINAFITLDEGIENSNQNTTAKNKLTMAAFETSMKGDPAKTKPYYERAQAAAKMSSDLTKFIEEIKNDIITTADKIEKGKPIPVPREIERNDDYDTPSLIMCAGGNNEGRTGKAGEVKKRLAEFKENMLKNLDADDRPKFQSRFDILLNTNDPDPKSELARREQKKTWEMATFYHTPVVASLAMLSKIQSDIKTAESEVNTQLLQKINAADLKFDQVVAKVVPSSNYVLTGQEYKADVFLAAYNSKTDAEILVNGNKLPVDSGLGKYVDHPSSEGVKKWGGVIKVKDPQDPTKTKDYSFETEYIAAKPAAVISPTKMNVFYIGVENPVSISVPGVPNNKVQPTITGGGCTLAKDPKGSGEAWIVKATTPGEANVAIVADFDGKKVNMGAQKFRVKYVPDPVAKVANTKGGNVNRSVLAAQSAVIAEMENFDFELYFKVKSFKMSLYRKGKDPLEVESTSNLITPTMKTALAQGRTGDKVYFEYIKAVGPDGRERKLSPVNIVVQ